MCILVRFKKKNPKIDHTRTIKPLTACIVHEFENAQNFDN